MFYSEHYKYRIVRKQNVYLYISNLHAYIRCKI